MERLVDDTTYNFIRDLYTLQHSDLGPNLEIFCFGTYEDYTKYKSKLIDILGSPELVNKLTKLTILSIFEKNEGLTVPRKQVLESSGLESALKELSKLKGKDPKILLDQLIITLVDEGSVDVKIDDENQELAITKVHKLRDTFDSRSYELRVLKESDIPDRSLRLATENLKKWHRERLTPVGSYLKKEVVQTISRKRKTPDQSMELRG